MRYKEGFMKKNLLLLLALPLLLTACGGGNEGGPESNDSGTSQQQVTKYTVTFANTSMASVQIEAGKTLAKPTDPQKANCVFVGWYMDAEFKQEVVFPLVINSDTTIYANFYSYQEAFAKARNNTIGDDVLGYEYEYTLDATATYMSLNLVGNTTGKSQYSSTATDVSFYDAHVNSGALFNDGSKYQIKRGRELHKISLDENDVVKKYTIEEVGEDYKYDTSSYAKALFEYKDEDLKSIEPTSVQNEYKLNTKFNASAAIALVGNYLNHPMVEKLIGELPDTSVNTGMYVTFSGDKLNTYRYVMSIDVSGIKFDLTYSLAFKNIGKAPTITPRIFNNTYVSASDVANMKTEINGYLNAFKALEHSSYDFKAKTAVDYAKKNAINATIDGFTKRKVSGNNVYYLNDYEVDTDHKNADLYKASGLGDCHGGRVKLSTGEVHDLKKKVLGGYSDVATVTHNPADNYYLLDVLEMISNVTFIEKLTDTEKGTITYAIGADTNGAVSVLKAFNNTLRLNPLGECSVDVKAYGDFVDSSVTLKDFQFKIVIKDGAFSELSLQMNGKMNVSFPNSRDFTAKQDAGYKLTYTLQVTDKGSDYEPAETVNKVK